MGYGEPLSFIGYADDDDVGYIINAVGMTIAENVVAVSGKRYCLAVNACTGLSDAALSQDVIAVVREALRPFAFRVSERIGDEDRPDDYKIQAVVSMQEIRAARAALALLATDKDDKS
jgi:hypothetical protein